MRGFTPRREARGRAGADRRRRTGLVAAVVVLAMAGAGCVPWPNNGAGQLPGSRVGFSTSGMFLWESDAQVNADLTAIVASGAKWIRISFDWNSVQSLGRGTWNWSYEDRVVGAARRRGLNVLGLAAYSPPWAHRSLVTCPTQTMYCPPDDPADYAAFVAAAAARYAPMGVHAWEIWNEPNWDPWWASARGPNAADYVALLKPAYTAIHQADHAAVVVTGGLAPHGDLGATPNDPRHPVNFLEAMYAAGAKGSFDAVGHHPYPPLPLAPLVGTLGWNALLYTQTMHNVMSANGDGAKKIWGTEWGVPTGTSAQAVSDTSQGLYIADEYHQWLTYTFAGPLFTHEIRDASGNLAAWSDNLGLEHVNGTAKPALAVLRYLMGH